MATLPFSKLNTELLVQIAQQLLPEERHDMNGPLQLDSSITMFPIGPKSSLDDYNIAFNIWMANQRIVAHKKSLSAYYHQAWSGFVLASHGMYDATHAAMAEDVEAEKKRVLARAQTFTEATDVAFEKADSEGVVWGYWELPIEPEMQEHIFGLHHHGELRKLRILDRFKLSDDLLI